MVEDVDLDENDDMFADPNEDDEDFEPFVKFNPVSKLTITVYRTVGIWTRDKFDFWMVESSLDGECSSFLMLNTVGIWIAN